MKWNTRPNDLKYRKDSLLLTYSSFFCHPLSFLQSYFSFMLLPFFHLFPTLFQLARFLLLFQRLLFFQNPLFLLLLKQFQGNSSRGSSRYSFEHQLLSKCFLLANKQRYALGILWENYSHKNESYHNCERIPEAARRIKTATRNVRAVITTTSNIRMRTYGVGKFLTAEWQGVYLCLTCKVQAYA